MPDLHGQDLLLSGRQIWLDGALRSAELEVRAGRVIRVGRPGEGAATDLPRLELKDLWVLPGMVDTQVHFREPGFPEKEDLESGSRAAVAGGMTAFLEMPNTKPLTITAEALADKVTRATARCWCDFGFFMGASPENVEQLPELERLPGCCGVKIFMGSSTGALLLPDDDGLRRALARGVSRVSVHAEDEPRLKALKATHPEADHPRWHPVLRDPECARLAVARLLAASEETGRPVHILHMNSAEEMDLLRALPAGVLGGRVTAELTPQHLLLAAPDCYEKLGWRVVMNPPIREERHRAALWQALQAGLIHVLGSDHAPHTRTQKGVPYPGAPSGMPGTETLLPLLLDQVLQGAISLERLVAVLAEGPARAFGMEGKGRIEPGARGDFTVLDPAAEWIVDDGGLQSRCGWSPFHGRRLRGRVSRTIIRGRVVYAEGALLGPPRGRALEFAHAR